MSSPYVESPDKSFTIRNNGEYPCQKHPEVRPVLTRKRPQEYMWQVLDIVCVDSSECQLTPCMLHTRCAIK
ncbi:hypothetical protein KKD37_04340 [Patescibacteria group bacterium]|nr:hypothetical protein [Patescibacteria group bacterium]